MIDSIKEKILSMLEIASVIFAESAIIAESFAETLREKMDD